MAATWNGSDPPLGDAPVESVDRLLEVFFDLIGLSPARRKRVINTIAGRLEFILRVAQAGVPVFRSDIYNALAEGLRKAERGGGSSKKPITVEDNWRVAANDSQLPRTAEQQAYLNWLDQQEAWRERRVRQLPQELRLLAAGKSKEARLVMNKAHQLLCRRQARILAELATFHEAGIRAEPSAARQATYAKLVMRAVRNGLQRYPGVPTFVFIQQALGDRKLLRLAASKLETGIRTYKSYKDFDLDEAIVSMWLEGKSLEQIRRGLESKHLLPAGRTFTRQGIHSHLHSLSKEFPWDLMLRTRPLPSP